MQSSRETAWLRGRRRIRVQQKITTCHDVELQEQARWQRLPRYARLDHFDKLVGNEFAPPEAQQRWQDRQLELTVRFASERVPYYRRRFKELGLSAGDIRCTADLVKLPVLGKLDVQSHERDLQPDELPSNEQLWPGSFRSSGTTGRPTRVVMTTSGNLMFTILSQRMFRWFRWRPEGKVAWIRAASTQPRLPDGSVLRDGQGHQWRHWRYVGRYYPTGSFVAFNRANPVEEQIAWLRRERPDYLTTYPGVLETFSYACCDESLVDSLKGVRTISSHLTPAARHRIERTFELPVDQSYGLNEIGLVATRCRAGRYHVHVEHCIVEIVDDQGRPCAPGESGSLLVTALRNRAMPLIRYDTRDLARAVDGPCPCGRTLPSFGGLLGRYRAWRHAPAGTAARVDYVEDTIKLMPDDLIRDLRQFQLHQYHDNTFELRLEASGSLPERFADELTAGWNKSFADTGLTIKEVDSLPPPPGGKQQEFTSDFFPDPSK